MGVYSRGDRVRNIINLRLAEAASLDHDQLEVLYVQLGPTGADRIVNRAMEDLATSLSQVEKHFSAGRMNDVRSGIANLAEIAGQIGMASLAKVACDAMVLTHGHDGPALCAVMARLVRIGECSLVAVWDLQDMTV